MRASNGIVLISSGMDLLLGVTESTEVCTVDIAGTLASDVAVAVEALDVGKLGGAVTDGSLSEISSVDLLLCDNPL